MNQRTNLDYRILDSLHIGNTEFVIGYNPNVTKKHVVWECINDKYYFGHFFKSRIAAEDDFLKRASASQKKQDKSFNL